MNTKYLMKLSDGSFILKDEINENDDRPKNSIAKFVKCNFYWGIYETYDKISFEDLTEIQKHLKELQTQAIDEMDQMVILRDDSDKMIFKDSKLYNTSLIFDKCKLIGRIFPTLEGWKTELDGGSYSQDEINEISKNIQLIKSSPVK
jgi:hypothetical protein